MRQLPCTAGMSSEADLFPFHHRGHRGLQFPPVLSRRVVAASKRPMTSSVASETFEYKSGVDLYVFFKYVKL